ncbi:HEPN domain-containing protein [Thermococcus sp.]|uniref:HEPN domain-containing protein n=1 Tax=Thermococcus sp. TaxID=35749 RepID=UPI0019C5539F|nr:HEPN domain-containing protein [Thermococcus sp.]MBC7095449.1 HEPN domain-containing protein [Thermococcus sp.]
MFDDDVFRAARILDRHYIPPRYPDAYVEGSPYEFYGVEDAEEAINAANTIINFITGVANDSL